MKYLIQEKEGQFRLREDHGNNCKLPVLTKVRQFNSAEEAKSALKAKLEEDNEKAIKYQEAQEGWKNVEVLGVEDIRNCGL